MKATVWSALKRWAKRGFWVAVLSTAVVSSLMVADLTQRNTSLSQQLHVMEETIANKDAEILVLGSEVDFLHNLIIWGGVGAGLLIIFLFGCVLILRRGLIQATQPREETTPPMEQAETLRAA